MQLRWSRETTATNASRAPPRPMKSMPVCTSNPMLGSSRSSVGWRATRSRNDSASSCPYTQRPVDQQRVIPAGNRLTCWWDERDMHATTLKDSQSGHRIWLYPYFAEFDAFRGQFWALGHFGYRRRSRIVPHTAQADSRDTDLSSRASARFDFLLQ